MGAESKTEFSRLWAGAEAGGRAEPYASGFARSVPLSSVSKKGPTMADIAFICYPKCSTCRKARAWLDAHGISYAERDISLENPTAGELKEWHAASGLSLRRFFNTSGMLYREQNVKAQLDQGMTDEEAYELLATNGMLVKRPLVVGDGFVLVGFREAEWEQALL